MYVVYWQMHSGMDVRAWQDYDTSPYLQQLKAHIEKVAVPCYMQSLGLPPQALPKFTIRIWAGVMGNKEEHSEHEHSTKGECLCSGVLYTQVPKGSGALRFLDPRKPTSPEMPVRAPA